MGQPHPDRLRPRFHLHAGRRPVRCRRHRAADRRRAQLLQYRDPRIAHTIFEEASKALQDSFKPIAETKIKLERIESRMDFAILGRRNNPAVVARLLVQAIGRGGKVFVILPHTTLNPLRQRLSQVIFGEMTNRDKE
ncbi:hypothetical protein [Breoghania sp.]|uniref:hypothetical protein n=1 Tax=Breoghania sp. TaxID=2065378 RepID=UPI003204CA51